MIVSEYVLLMMPERFWLWYSVMIPVLLLMRYPDYRQRKWLFFYLDFCYYVQVGLVFFVVGSCDSDCCFWFFLLLLFFVFPSSARLAMACCRFSASGAGWYQVLSRSSTQQRAVLYNALPGNVHFCVLHSFS